ncbi:hypothetical protein ACP4OV_001505 [Aristida adscensionis]
MTDFLNILDILLQEHGLYIVHYPTFQDAKTTHGSIPHFQMPAMPRPFTIPYVLSILLLASSHQQMLSSCFAADTISANQVLAYNDKLISSNGKFVLGFFHTSSESSNTTKNWYLGIWFNKVPKLIPVWVANRQNPIIDPTTSELKMSLDGSLFILDKVTNSKIWSSQVGNMAARNHTVTVLLNNGNLVLRDATNLSIVLWQSFDYPTDVLLPGAKVGWDKVTGLNRRLISKRNMFDLSPGFYCSELDPSGAHQFIIKLCNSSIVYFSTGVWNGKYFNSLPGMSGEIQSNRYCEYNFVDNEKEVYFTYNIRDDTLITFSLLDISGQSKQLVWLEESQDWLAVDTQPKAQCDAYAVCGPFTICNDNKFPLCSCMKGFSTASQKDWELGDQTGGCIRNVALDCESKQRSTMSTDKFYSMSHVRLPSNAKIIEAAANADECARACLSQCSCTAYSYATRCSIWQTKLLNVVQQQYGNSSSTSEEIIYLRLAAKEMQSWRHNRRKTIICVSIAAFGMSSAFILLLLVICRNKTEAFASIFSNPQRDGGITAFKYAELRFATKNFSERLGGGGFGTVFKGFLHQSSTTIAVKRLDGAYQGEKQFRAEVSSIGIIQHINLVKLIGFCCERKKRLLVYEHMPNGSLDAHLFHGNASVLKWSIRYQICLGVAKGLAYLHHSCQECIIHCDIKPQNILLDALFVPKVADFGMAKFLGRDFSRVLTTVRGTIGYLAPEWISGVAITPKVDVYSYGMMLLEIVSGRRNSEDLTSNRNQDTYFPVKVASKLLEGDVQSLVDKKLCGDANLEEIERVCKLACWCIQDNELNRPSMGEAVQILEGAMKLNMPPVPKIIQVMS